ncbi:MAG: TDP-N-acetylfucosamine:lipid II N-acetylfucosaminyltransferase [Sulfurospirillum sp.]|nr:TDP-N-acetylfucosamine:lipid II N-acetylfucosaminyltransferase [Sulfurospirillum sp.]
MSKIIHLGRNGSIMNSFVKFIDENFDNKKHFFYLTGKDINTKSNVIDIRNKIDFIKNIIKLNIDLYKSEKIIVHGFNQSYLFYLFFFQPWLLKKSYWIMWGGDLYSYLQKPKSLKMKLLYFIRDSIFKKIAYLVTGTTGDYELAKKWYGATGKHIKCFNYPSNLYKEYDIKPKEHSTINIQLGNSADPTNNHIDVLKQLTKYKDEDIQIFVPLSYGNQEYAQDVTRKGKELFGNKFISLAEFIPFEKYLEFLGEMDIAIFNHRRQQAFGNIISLIGMGKKVYLNSESTLNGVMTKYDLKVFDTIDISLNLLDNEQKIKNINIVKTNFSKESFINSLSQYLK